MILVDTSVWIEFFRAKSNRALVVDQLLEENQVAVCGPILTEIYRGIRSNKDRAQIIGLFEGCHFLSQPSDLWKEAGLLGSNLRKNGATVKSMDLLIATYALAHDVSLLTMDSDFKFIQKVGIPLKLF